MLIQHVEASFKPACRQRPRQRPGSATRDFRPSIFSLERQKGADAFVLKTTATPPYLEEVKRTLFIRPSAHRALCIAADL